MCEAEIVEAALRCGSCGANLQSTLFQDRSGLTLEGIGVSLFIVFILGSWVWSRIEPTVYQVAPDLGATKQGPPGFPVLVQIRQTSLSIANGSEEQWACKVGISLPEIYAESFTLEPRESRELPYASFKRGSTGLTNAAGYSRARQGISVDCKSRSGVSHLVHF